MKRAFWQVLNELITNAIIFTAANHHPARRTACGEKEVCFTVRDQAAHVPEKLEKILARLPIQQRRSDTRARGGTGLGSPSVAA